MCEPKDHESGSELRARLSATERDLEEVRSLFTAIFDAGPFPMWISDDKGTCVKVNETNRRKWGLTDEAVVGRYNLFDDPVLQEQGHIPLIESVFRDGRTVTFQNEYDAVRFNQLTGANRDFKTVIEATVAPVKNAQGHVTHAIIQQKDLTEIARAQEARDEAIAKMKQAQKLEAIGLLAAGVAHEINQPLTYIRAIFECTLHDLEQQKMDPRELEEDCREAVKQVDRISRIIGHLRTFGRAETLSFKEVALDQVLDNTLILVDHLLQTNQITLQRDIPKNLPAIHCDAMQMEQVFINLFQNSIAALKNAKDKKITITAMAREDLLILCFYDNGVGVPPVLQDKIFDPFVTTREVGEGTGLGLSIVYGIIKEHDGDIQYYAEEQGSTFVITLPLNRADHARPQ